MKPTVIEVAVEVEPLDPKTVEETYDFDEVKLPNVPISAFNFCDRISKALEAAGIRTVGQLMTFLSENATVRAGRFKSGIGDLGPNATAVILLTLYQWSIADYEDVAPVLNLTGCVDPECECLWLTPDMSEELARQRALYQKDPLFGLAARRPA